MPAHPESKHLRKAYLTSLNEGVIELYRDWRAARTPPITMEGRGVGELTLAPLPASDFARESGYFVDERGKVVFVFYPSVYSDDTYRGASVYVAGSFNGWQNAVGNPDWELTPSRVGGKRALTLTKDLDIFSCDEGCGFKFVTDSHHWFPAAENASNLMQDGMGNWNYAFNAKVSGRHRLRFSLKRPVDLSENNAFIYQMRKETERCSLQPGAFLMDLRSDKALGALVENGTTTFRLFAPRAKWVKVGFFRDLSAPEEVDWLLMKRAEDFVWEAVVDQDLHGAYYWYRLDGPHNEFSLFDPNFRVLDPYAKAAVGAQGPGIVIDENQLDLPARRRFTAPQWQDLLIMEGHVRDLVAKAPGRREPNETPWGFKDLEAYARRPDFYPKRLSVNALELLPVQENDSRSYGEYHWGYMTVNFFAPHSGYASDPAAASQILEFRSLVDALHERGLAVIMDVVYNHVGEPAHLMYVDKQYYFHADGAGRLTNWSGCGNDLRMEAPMARRLMIDSLKHMVEFYGVDGFRFDLADLVGKPALQEVEAALKPIRPDIILIAEPWSFKGHIGRELRDTGFSYWNDGYREFLKRFVRGEAPAESARYFLEGSPIHYATWPSQTVNYVESHDDRVWVDEITEHGGFDGTRPTGNDVARTRLMIAVMMMSIGIPMLHAGMDFLSSKNGVRNTYQDGPRNELDYRRALAFPGCAEYFASWAAFRQSASGSLLRHYSRAPEGFFEYLGGGNGLAFACVYNASGAWGARRLLFAANPAVVDAEIDLGDWGGRLWRQLADHERFLPSSESLWSNRPEKTLYLPPLAAGLWELDAGR